MVMKYNKIKSPDGCKPAHVIKEQRITLEKAKNEMALEAFTQLCSRGHTVCTPNGQPKNGINQWTPEEILLSLTWYELTRDEYNTLRNMPSDHKRDGGCKCSDCDKYVF